LDIAKASQNTIMPMLLDPIHRLMPEIKLSIYKVVGEKVAKESATKWHGKILQEIIAQNPEGARFAMEEHLKRAAEHAEEMLRALEVK
jgi:DNA-binding FadR family transcriptional regulator